MGQSIGQDRLRERAEERLRRKPYAPDELTEAEAKKLLHELQVHQIELEMQNDELRKAQAEVEESRSRYAELYDFSPVGYLTIDRKGLILEANLTASEMLGVQRSSLVGGSFMRFITSKNKNAFAGHIAASVGYGEKFSFEVGLRNKDGQGSFALLDCTTAERLDGKTSVMLSITDITALRLAEEAYRNVQQAKLQSILDNSPTVIYVKDLSGRHLFVNRRFETLYKLTKEEVAGKTDNDLFAREAAESCWAKDLDVLRAEGPVELEEVVNQDDGPHTYLSVRFPLRDAAGEVEAVCGISMDITDRKHLEEEQAKIQKLESLGLLAGGIAHDFNNLLTGILGNISLLERRFFDDEYTCERMTEVEKAALQARELTQQLLTFSKGGQPVKDSSCLEDIITRATSLALSGSNVRCESSFPDDLWPVYVDEAQIAQVFSNLVINADQAMPDGGILKIRAENKTVSEKDNLPIENGRYVLISVEDQGAGILDEDITRVFDPYFTTKLHGSGLGLATSFSIVKRHGGHVEASSIDGSGATFRVYLPASESEVALKPVAAAEPPASASGRILVMDDEEVIRDVAEAILVRYGYEVCTSADGVEAIRLYKEAQGRGEPFDAVIMDLTVPGGVGGIEATRTLLEFDPGVRVIVSSGYSNDPVMSDFGKYGFCAVVTKPYTATDLGAKVYRVLSGDEG